MGQIKLFINIPEQKKSTTGGRLSAELSGIKKELRNIKKLSGKNRLAKKTLKKTGASKGPKSNLLLNELRGLRTDMRKNKGHKNGPGNSNLLAKQLKNLSREIGGLAHSSHVGGG